MISINSLDQSSIKNLNSYRKINFRLHARHAQKNVKHRRVFKKAGAGMRAFVKRLAVVHEALRAHRVESAVILSVQAVVMTTIRIGVKHVKNCHISLVIKSNVLKNVQTELML